MLSDTQCQAIDLLAQGLNDAEVGRRLGVRSLVVHAWRVYDAEFKQALRRHRSQGAKAEPTPPPAAPPDEVEPSEPPPAPDAVAATPPVDKPVVTPPEAPAAQPPMVTTRMASFS